MSLSSISHVKRTDGPDRPPAPPIASFTGFTGDRSGSMSSMGGKQKEMTHQMITQVQADAKKSGIPTFFDFCTFDDSAEVHLDNAKLNSMSLPDKQAISDSMEPRGCTRLIDTALERLAAQNRAVKAYRKSLPTAVQKLNPVIAQSYSFLTDGQDNSSKWGHKELREAMGRYRSAGGKGIFLAANMDAVSVGGHYGFAPETSLTISSHNQAAIGSGLRSATQCLRQVSAGNNCPAFSGLQRATSQGPTYHSAPAGGGYGGGSKGHGNQLHSLRQPAAPLRRNVGPPNRILRQNAMSLRQPAFSGSLTDSDSD
jgi:hypothetical protein